MKSSLTILLSTIVSLCSLGGIAAFAQKHETRRLTDAEKRMAEATNGFGFRLLHEVNRGEAGRNVFVSPLSVATALGMALNGADGSTEIAILATLGYAGTTRDEINVSNAGLMQLLMNLDPKVQFNIANSIWYRDDININALFAETNQRFYGASVRGLNFSSAGASDTINSWVSTSTKGKIHAIVPKPIPPDMMLYLINAAYFKGTWTHQFEKTLTRDAPFYSSNGTKQVKLMSQRVTLPYTEKATYQAIELPYGDSLFTSIVVLPRPNVDIETFASEMTGKSWSALTANLRKAKGTVFLPKFKIEYEKSLNEALKAMGLGNAFGNNADFSRISSQRGFAISDVRHKTFVQVDEEGTEAAAVTSIGVATYRAYHPESPFVMRVDRPFIFAIVERTTGALLFVGKIVDPE
jgi:serpin B